MVFFVFLVGYDPKVDLLSDYLASFNFPYITGLIFFLLQFIITSFHFPSLLALYWNYSFENFWITIYYSQRPLQGPRANVALKIFDWFKITIKSVILNLLPKKHPKTDQKGYIQDLNYDNSDK